MHSQGYQISRRVQQVLTVTAEEVARREGFGQRPGKLAGARWAQTLVCGFLAHPEASLQDLAQVAATVAEPVTPQAVDERFTPQGADYLQSLLVATVEKVVRAAEPATAEILHRFTSVCVQDSTVISLPAVFEKQFRGCRGSTAEAGRSAVKFQVRFDLLRGGIEGLHIEEGRSSDYTTPLQTENIEPGSLHLRDLGYFALDVLATIDAKKACFLSRLHDQAAVLDADDKPIDVVKWLSGQRGRVVERDVRLGREHRLSCRLVVVRVPPAMAKRRRRQLRRHGKRKGYTPSKRKLALCDWNLYITNVPVEMLSVEEIVTLGRMRWQIELLFKQWKSEGCLARSRSEKPWRIMAEVFAKMIAMILQHWILLATCWRYADRSLRRATKAVRRLAGMLAASLHRTRDVMRVMELIDLSLRRTARIDHRREHPNAHHLLENPKQYGYRLYG